MRAHGDLIYRLRRARGRRDLFMSYARDRLEERDLHGVADAAMDLREIQQEIDTLEWVLNEGKQ